ncbi:MAG TPA: AI-2E family transporter [Candidatus Faecalibacterium avium]|uniref:AI-2E family transporter n=1 Tax=Faecalibacterium sp. An121 TaxID=1965550 RepID=UPI000B37EF58|nr:AI-2E family transporter [Faecalibacterium sp. An121]OUQ37002.1 hypothetical protein B5E66_09690 [Faecalibacterium sp. An121]HIV43285.1 AI-2E family transporter [Candidatus Faecalibacterium avium]
MEKQNKRFAAFLVFGGIAFYFGLTHFNTVTHWASALIGLCTPVVIGGIIAFLLNVPMTAIENGLKKLFRRQPKRAGKGLRMLSLLLTFVCIIVVVALAVLMLIPELRKSIMSVIVQIQESLPGIIDYLYSLGIDSSVLTMVEQQLASINLREVAQQMITGASSMLGTLVGAVTATVSVLGNALFSTVIALYILIDKENLSRQCRKLLYAFVEPQVGDKIWHVGSLIREVFGKFLGGQSIESCLLGFLMFVALSVFRIPYASLIAVLTAVCAFIPYIGAFLSCGIGVALILLVNPLQALLCLVVYQVVQFIENQFIYPHVVGSSVGLEPLWTIIAVLVGGAAFGVLGMIFFIPVMAVVYILLKESVNARIERKMAAARQAQAAEEDAALQVLEDEEPADGNG